MWINLTGPKLIVGVGRDWFSVCGGYVSQIGSELLRSLIDTLHRVIKHVTGTMVGSLMFYQNVYCIFICSCASSTHRPCVLCGYCWCSSPLPNAIGLSRDSVQYRNWWTWNKNSGSSPTIWKPSATVLWLYLTTVSDTFSVLWYWLHRFCTDNWRSS